MIDALHALNHWLSAHHGMAELFVIVVASWPVIAALIGVRWLIRLIREWQ